MGETTSTTLATGPFITAGMTPIFSATTHVIPVVTANDWVEFVLPTPVPYDKTKNFIIEVAHDGFSNGFDISNATVTNRRLQGDNPNTNGTADNFLADFGFDVALPCNKVDVSSIQKTNITINSANISWASPGQSTVQYEYFIDNSPLDPPSSGYAFTTTPSLQLKDLTPGTCYYVHIKTHCDPQQSLYNKDTSGWIVDSFCTLVDCVIPEVTIDRISSTVAYATWAAVPTVLYYEYSVGTTPDTPTNGNITSYTSVKLQGLWPNKPLYFYLKSHCSVIPNSPWGTTPFHTMAHTGVTGMTIDEPVLFAYPNPVTDMVRVRLTSKDLKDAAIYLTDMTGRTFGTYKITGNEMQLDMSKMPAGMYLLKLEGTGIADVIRINKQ
jgi:hypothetical protein